GIAFQNICDERSRNRGNVEHACLRIEGTALPVGAAYGSWQLNRSTDAFRAFAANGRRREQRTDPVILEERDRVGAQLRRKVNQIVDRHTLSIEGRWFGRERLRR